ncbi:unnamed protein product, partial [Didymodactylos carnosus]
DIRLYAVNNSIDDWKVSLTPSKVLAIIGEAFICLIQPLPWLPDSYISSSANSSTSTHVPVNVILSIFMFTRVYLVCRCLIYHSTIVTDSSSQSIGFLNRVKFNFKFILKAYLTQHPVLSLAVILFTIFLIASWCLRAVDYNSTKDGQLAFLDAMYLFMLSLTSLGYGDLIPSTNWGRAIAGLCCLIGIFISAVLIAILAQKLDFSRSEKYVHIFVLNTELAKQEIVNQVCPT